MPPEARRHVRAYILPQRIEAALDGPNFDPRNRRCIVRDVSAFGAGLLVGGALDPGARISLSVHGDEGPASASGTVVWCRPISGSLSEHANSLHYRAGIEFDVAELDANVAFFIAIKRRVDSQPEGAT